MQEGYSDVNAYNTIAGLVHTVNVKISWWKFSLYLWAPLQHENKVHKMSTIIIIHGPCCRQSIHYRHYTITTCQFVETTYQTPPYSEGPLFVS